MIIKDNKELSRKVRVVNGVEKDCQQILKIINGTEHVIWGGGRAIDLGTGTSFDIKSVYSKYKDLTLDNFYVLSWGSVGGSDSAGYMEYVTLVSGINKSYDAERGILTCYAFCNNNTAACHVVLVVRPSKLTSLGTGTTFVLTNIPNYQNLTVDNFIALNVNKNRYDYNGYREVGGDGSEMTEMVKSYDANSGTLTFYHRAYGSSYVDRWDDKNPMANVIIVKSIRR